MPPVPPLVTRGLSALTLGRAPRAGAGETSAVRHEDLGDVRAASFWTLRTPGLFPQGALKDFLTHTDWEQRWCCRN